MNKCSACDNKSINKNEFCTECGSSLCEKNFSVYKSDMRSSFSLEKFQQTKIFKIIKQSKKKWTVLIGLTIFIVIVLQFIGGIRTSPTAVAEEFIEYCIDNEWEEARGLWDESGVNHMLYMTSRYEDTTYVYFLMNTLTQLYSNGSVISELDEYKVNAEDVREEEAEIYFDFLFDNGKQDHVRFHMVKEDKKWKVLNFERKDSPVYE